MASSESATAQFLAQCWTEAVSAARSRHGLPAVSAASVASPDPSAHVPTSSTTDASCPTHTEDTDKGEGNREEAAMPARASREYGRAEKVTWSARRTSAHSPTPRAPSAADSRAVASSGRPLTIERAHSNSARVQTPPPPPPVPLSSSSSTMARDSSVAGSEAAARQPSRRQPAYTVEAQPNLVRGRRPSMGTNGVAWVIQ